MASVRCLAVLVLLAACGDDYYDIGPDDDGSEDDNDPDPDPDEDFDGDDSRPPPPTDAALDQCGRPIGPSRDYCDPLDSAICAANEKCAWIVESVDPACGHPGCVPAGTIEVGAVCQPSADGVADDCVRGAYCDDVCRTVCHLSGAEPICGSEQTCQAVTGAFVTETTPPTTFAGVCR
jgi:hypothetical protein